MANIDGFNIQSPKSDVVVVTAVLKGAGAAALVPQAENGIKSFVSGVTRSSLGVFALTFRHEYAQLLAAFAIVRGATAGIKPRFSAIDVSARTATLKTETFGDGTAAAYQTGVVVSANTVTLGQAGVVTFVEATTATSAGVKTIQSTGSPGAGKVEVTYAAGVPTLTFNSGDAVTAATVMQIPGDASSQLVDPGATDYIDLILLVRNTKLN